MEFILLDGLAFSDVWTQFIGAFSSATSFFQSQPIFLALIGIPVGAFVVGTIVKTIR